MLSRRPISLARRVAYDAAICAVTATVCMAILGWTTYRSRHIAPDSMIDSMREGLGTEVRLAKASAPAAEVGQSVDSIRRFIHERSGVEIDPEIARRLTALEERTLRGEARRLTTDELAEAVSATLLDRIRTCTDAEIDHAAAAFGNILQPGPIDPTGDVEEATRVATALARRSRGVGASPVETRVMLRFHGAGQMSNDKFVAMVKHIRTQLAFEHVRLAALGHARAAVAHDLDRRIGLFEQALPADWGPARVEGVTPVQALLLAYSAASDDSLVYPTPVLRRVSEETVERYLRSAPKTASFAASRTPYGVYGDMFSTPLDLVFDRATLGRLLDRIEERSSR